MGAKAWLGVVLILGACGGDAEPARNGEAGAETTADTAATTGRATVGGQAAADSTAADSHASADTVAPSRVTSPAVRDTPRSGRADTTVASAQPPARDPGAAALRRASEVYEDLRSLRADFTMTMRNPILRSTTTSRGTLYQRSPDRLLLRFSEPEGDVIVSDGTYFWVYYPSIDPNQVTRLPAAQAGAGGVDLRAQFVGDPVQRFDYTYEGMESLDGRNAHVLTLRPRQGTGYESLKVWIDDADALVRHFEIREQNGAVRRFDLSGLQRNPNLADDLFRFTPPAGARVIERV